VRPDLISCHLPVRQHQEENIDNIVGKCPTIVRKGHWAARVVGKNAWQQLSGFADRFLSRITARVFQLMGEDADEPIIFGRMPVQVRCSLFSRQENCLQWSPAAICLDPAFSSLVHCASPKSHLFTAQSRIGQLKHDAANILVREKIIASELHEVYAFFIETSMLPIQELSIRTWATMFPPSSATAMFMGCPISCAFFSAAPITRRASSSFTADMRPP